MRVMVAMMTMVMLMMIMMMIVNALLLLTVVARDCCLLTGMNRYSFSCNYWAFGRSTVFCVLIPDFW